MNNKKKYFALVMVILTVVIIISLLEGVSRIYLNRLENSNYISPGMFKFDRMLGWTLNDGIYLQNHIDFQTNYTISDGKRLTVNNGCNDSRRTINLFGDSFTFGIGVNDYETIASLLSKELAGKYCVNNYGISGYGPDQYKLLYDMKDVSDISVFIILTGNDYIDINSNMDQGEVRYKPFLVSENNHYRWGFPEPTSYDKSTNIKQSRFSFQLLFLLRNSLKKIPIIVNLRNYFVKADIDYVKSSIDKFDFLYKSMDRDKTYFLIVPSYSLASGISKYTNEGSFEQLLNEYLTDHNFKHVSLYKQNTLKIEDYWIHEGHPNPNGNLKIAMSISNMIKIAN